MAKTRALPGEAQDLIEDLAQLPEGTGCVDWPFAVSGNGIPQIRKYQASHILLELRGVERPTPKHEVMHSCDRPICLAWWHLRWGTRSENMQDMVAKRRGRWDKRRANLEETT